MSTTIAANTVATINGRRRRQRRRHRIRAQGSIAVSLKCEKWVSLPHPPVLTLTRLGLRGQISRAAEGCRDGSRFLRTFLQWSAAWALAEVNVEVLRCGATTIVRYLDARGRPLHAIVGVCGGHADQVERQGPVRDLRGFP